MFFVLSKILDVLLGPLTWTLLLVAASLALHARRPRAARVTAVSAVVVLYVFSLDPVAMLLWRSLEHDARPSYRPDVGYDAVIVLGGALDHAGGALSPLDVGYNENVERVLAAFELVRADRARDVLFSGGNARPGAGPPEADVLAQQLRDWGVDPARVFVEADSRNTRENAVYSAKIVAAHGWKKLLLVTSAFHMTRAAGCFAAVGLAPDRLPVDYRGDPQSERFAILPRANALAVSTAALHEWFGRIVYRLRGYSVAVALFLVPMDYRRLGKHGLKVSVLGFGGWMTMGHHVKEESVAEKLLVRAFEAGINFFDIADIYAHGEAERVMGRILLKHFPRQKLVLSSKVFWPMSDDPNDRGLSRKHIFESVHASLKRIGTDYLDLYFCHRFDEDTPLEETVRAMDDLVRMGKVLHWGTSEWTGVQLREARAVAERGGHYGPAVEQPELSLLCRTKYERDTRPAAVEGGMGLVTWSPLASGVLTGKYDHGVPKDSRLADMTWLGEELLTHANVDRVRRMKAIADEAGCTRAQLAIAWTAAQFGVSSVITGATRVEQLEENLGASKVKMTPALSAKLDALFPGG